MLQNTARRTSQRAMHAPGLTGVAVHLLGCELEPDRQCDEPLLRAVVQIPLDPPALVTHAPPFGLR